MKRYVVTMIMVLSVMPAAAQAQATKAPAAGSNAAAQVRHQASGVVKGVDAKTGTATIEHGPVKSLNWPGMTMPFTVTDPAVRAKLVVGKKVEFEFEQRGTMYVIVAAR